MRDYDTRVEFLPDLNRLAFANWEYYSHKCEDFWQQTSLAPPIVRYPIEDLTEEDSRQLFDSAPGACKGSKETIKQVLG